MKRFWIGISVLAILLASGWVVACFMDRCHAPIGDALVEASQVALEGQLAQASQIAQRAQKQWLHCRDFTAAFADHSVLEEMDALFAEIAVCAAAQDIDFEGIAFISARATHVDCRGYRWWADETKGNKKVSDFYAYFGMAYPEPTETVKKGDKGTPVRWVQNRMNKAGYKLSVDGEFGGGTDKDVRDFQKKKGLTVDGKVGRNTRNALKKY